MEIFLSFSCEKKKIARYPALVISYRFYSLRQMVVVVCEWKWICDIWCRYLTGFLYFTGINFLLTFFAAILCVCFAPTAAGPGIPEIKAYLNGVDTPNMYGATTLFVKVSFLCCMFCFPFWFSNFCEFFGGLGNRLIKEQK